MLSKTQQLSIDGGRRDCAYYDSEWDMVVSHLTPAQAQSYLANPGDHWCCDSCATASWANRICTHPDYREWDHECLE
ncbi:MAG: rSAM-modified peptide [Bacteroidota bacterium]